MFGVTFIDAHYEEIAAVDDDNPTAEQTKQTIKEIVTRDEKLMLQNNNSSIK